MSKWPDAGALAGSKTFDRFEMRIHKRVIDLFSSNDVVKQIVRRVCMLPLSASILGCFVGILFFFSCLTRTASV